MRRLVLAIAAVVAVVSTAGAGPVVFNPANGHYYQFVEGTDTWTNSRAAAASQSFLGMTGHLATISNAAENTFVANLVSTYSNPTNFRSRGWIGAFSTGGPTGPYRWVTDELFGFTNWAPGEPSNAANELFVEMFASGQWNNNQNIDPTAAFRTSGYVVEFEPVPEPLSVAVFGGLLAAGGLAVRRRMKAKA